MHATQGWSRQKKGCRLFSRRAAPALLAAAGAFAQEGAPPATPSVSPPEFSEDVTVAGTRSVIKQPQSIGILTREDLKRNEGIFLDDTLNLTPGVRYESRT